MSSSKKSGKGQPFPLIRRRSEERRELVEKQLTKKFGNLPEKLSEKIHLMNDPLLDVLSLEILDFQSFEDLIKFIKRMNL